MVASQRRNMSATTPTSQRRSPLRGGDGDSEEGHILSFSSQPRRKTPEHIVANGGTCGFSASLDTDSTTSVTIATIHSRIGFPTTDPFFGNSAAATQGIQVGQAHRHD